MAMTKQNFKNDNIIMRTIEELVPKDHLVRKMENSMDFKFIEDEVKDLYSDYGRPSIPPVVLFKMLILNKTFGINSMRRTCEEIEVNLAYRWFLGLSIDDKVPNYSTWSQNYIRRYKDSEIFQTLFDKVLDQAIDYGFVDVSSVFGDSTHQKANANKNKHKDIEVAITKKEYADELLNEINKDRVNHGKKEIKDIVNNEIMFDENTGEVIENIDTKHIKQSLTDPESGCFHKGEKEKCFAYSHHIFTDKNGFVIAKTTIPGNIHDSESFSGVYNVLNQKFKYQINNICLDSAYAAPAICKMIIENGHTPLMPYKRPMTKKGFFKKYEYVYDEYYDCYICPNNEVLTYSNTNKKGYKEYKSNPEKCKKCPFREQCTQSKNMQKIITRHVWEEYKEQMNENRYTQNWKDNYPLRKETVERVFGDCKEQMGLRFTRVRGLQKNSHNSTMIFTCHNLKKMALWSWKYKESNNSNTSFISSIIKNIVDNLKISNLKVISLFRHTTLSTV